MSTSAVPLHNTTSYNFQQAIILQAPVPILIVEGAEFIISIINEKNLDKWQRTQEEVLGKPLFEVFPEAKAQSFYGFLTDVYQTGVGKKLLEEKAEFYRNGVLDTAWFDVSYEPIKNQKGEVTAIMVISVEITEQVLVRKKAENSEKELKSITDSIAHLIWIADDKGNIDFFNKRVYEYCGLEESMNKNLLWQNIIHPDDFKRTLKVWQNAIDEKTIYSIQHRLRSGNGSYHWFLSRAFYQENAENKIAKWFGSSTDISEQKIAEAEVRQSENRYRRIFENTPASIWEQDFSPLKRKIDQLSQAGITDFEAYFEVHKDELLALIDSVIIKDANATSLKLYDCGKEEIMKGLRQFYTPETLPAFVKGLAVIARGGGHYEAESIIRNKAGKLLNLMVYVDFPSEQDDYSSVQVIRFDITDRKKSENALKYRQALLEAQNEAVPDAILIVDEEGKMVSFNKKFAKIWGMPHEVIASQDDYTALAYAMTQVIDPEGFMERVKNCYANPAVKAHDEILLKDGRILDRYGNVVIGEDGTNYGWAWYFRDITEHKKIELFIHENEEKYRGLFKQMNQGFCLIEMIFDANDEPVDYRFLESNPMFKHQTGLNHADGKTMKELVPDIEISWSQIYGKVALTGESVRFTDYSQAMNTWFEVYAFRLGDRNNNKVAILFTNITERKKAEIEINEKEERFRMLTETIPQMVWMTDEIGNPEYLSSQWIEYAGEMPMAEYWTVICHPDDIEHSSNDWQKSVATGEKFTSEIRLKNKEGEYRWHVSVGVPLKDDQGNIIKWIGSISDVHDQKLKEQKKDEFISIASHEMKTPLTSTKAYLQLLEMSLDENDPNFIYAQKASEATERLHKLISELLDSSKIQHGKLNYNPTNFDFDQMIDSTIENVQYSSVTHKIIKSGLIHKHFWGDRDRLQQVVINLLTNAIKYSPKAHEVMVKIEEQNNQVLVSVIDKGVGMSEKHLQKVFDRYYRVEEHSIQFQGLGIGLYISYDIIQRHNGKMWVESVSGEGSTFHFILPFNNTIL